MWQQFFEPTGTLSWQALEDVLEVNIWIVSIELCALDERHHIRGTLTGSQ
jgi:hypothetical protein